MNGIEGFFIRETTGIPNTPDAFLYFEAVKGDAGGTIGFRQVNPGEAAMKAMDQMGPVNGGGYGMGSMMAHAGFTMYSITGEVVYLIAVLEAGRQGRTLTSDEKEKLIVFELGLNAMAEGVKEALVDDPEKQIQVVKDTASDAKEFAAQADFVNAVSADGHEAYFLFQDGLNATQEADGVDYTINSVGLLIDKDRHIALGMRFDGVAKRKGKSEPFFIQRIDRKHQYLKSMNGGDTTMLIPHETTMTLGLPSISKKDQKDLAKARKDLAEARREFEQNRGQLDALPANQRARFEEMMENALKQAERQVRLLENKQTMQITKTVVDARAGSVAQYAEWLKEEIKKEDAITRAQ
ncbi:hypothetical protein [Hyphococcus luteus]|nr:hypothetical protein [Marinicaulis flavus]